MDFYDYNEINDVSILSLDAKKLNFKEVIQHAKSITSKLIIGRHAYEHRKDVLSALNNNKHILLNNGIYLIHLT